MKNLIDLEDVKIASLSDLETFFREKNIPQEKTRFFVNENRQDPKCFGIYQDVDTGNFIVYKNKSDGSRTVRYEGVDEKLAVSIFFDKLKEEMAKRDTQGLYKSSIEQTKNKEKQKKEEIKRKLVPYVIFIGGILAFVLIYWSVIKIGSWIETSIKNINEPRIGYYNYDNTHYYYGNHAWWYYDDYYDDWEYYDGYIDDYNDYYYGKDYDSSYEYSDITDSYDYKTYGEKWEHTHDDSSSWFDSDWSSDWSYSSEDFDSYDWDSWDSSDTDWDSDW